MKNDKVKSIIVLTAICLIVTALLAVTNHFTAPVISNAREQKIQNSLKTVLPDMYSINEIKQLPEGTPATVKNVYMVNGDHYAVVLATTSAYSSGDMGITVGISPEGKIVGITLTSYFESKDFGKKTYPQSFLGLDAAGAESVDVHAGVTYSSKAFKAAIADAFKVIELIKGGEEG